MSARLAGLQAAVRTRQARGLIVLSSSESDPDLSSLVGPAHLTGAFAVVPAAGEPLLVYLTAMEREEAAATGLRAVGPADLDLTTLGARLGRDAPRFLTEAIRRGLRHLSIEAGSLLVAGSAGAGTVSEVAAELAAEGWELGSGHELLRLARKEKTPSELAELRRAAQVLSRAFRAIAALLAAASPQRGGGLSLEGEPLRAARLRAEAAAVFAAGGLEQPHGAIVAAGAAAGVPHTQGAADRRLRAGEAILVDLFPKSSLWVDCTRTFCVGEPPPDLAAAHAQVLSALELARQLAAAGAAGGELQRRVCTHFEAGGYRTVERDPETLTGYVHGLGHGVGYELHELPSFRPAAAPSSQRLDVGDVFTLEPGLYDAERGFGVRLEDLFALRADGVEALTPLPHDLDPRAW